MFEFMKVITLRAVFEAQDSGTLPAYLGSTVRGILGHCMREFDCNTPHIKCFLCNLRQECEYARYFSNTGGEGGAVNPFALMVRTRGKTAWQKGDVCEFDLTLFGNAADHANLYVDALQAMEGKGWGASRLSFRLLRIIEPNKGRLIFGGGKIWLRNIAPYAVSIPERRPGTVCVAFDTPVRIVSGKQLFETLPFSTLIRFISGRLSLLTQIYTDYKLEWNEEELLAAANSVKTVTEKWDNVPFARYSMNQPSGKLELPAQIGWAMYEGELEPFVPLLEMGRYIHVGKGATIGFGHYEISYDR